MPRILTTKAIIQCPHGGLGVTTPLSPIWQIDGGFALAEGDTGVLSCPFFYHPCVGYTLQSMGLNASKMLERSVILETDFQKSITGLPLTITDTHFMMDDSVPAPVPAGGEAGELDAFLIDLLEPQVQASPTSQTISATSGAPVMVSFSLLADYPLEWTLTLIDTKTPDNIDLTGGSSAATVIPSGGEWTTNSLTVSVTLPPPITLAAGKHYLFMTGVSQRGKTGYAEFEITVTP